MTEAEFYDVLRSGTGLRSPETYRVLCDFAVVRLAQILPLAGLLARSKEWNHDLIVMFRDAFDRFLALYGSFGDATVVVRVIKQQNSQLFEQLRAALLQLESFGISAAADETEQVSVPVQGWDGETFSTPVESILARRRIVLSNVERSS